MSAPLEAVIENFLQELLHINHISVTNFRKHHKGASSEADSSRYISDMTQNDNPLVMVNMDKFRLDKSLERLRNVSRLEWNNRSVADQPNL